jgi:hypothetical protein
VCSQHHHQKSHTQQMAIRLKHACMLQETV